MKRIVICLVVILLASSHAYGQLPPQGYIGLWANENRGDWCINGTGLFTIYCFAFPPETGMKCIELRTELSSENIVLFSPVYSVYAKQPILGGVPGNLAMCFEFCQATDWVRAFSATLFVMTQTEESITLGPFTGSPYMKILNCEGVETEALQFVPPIGINDPMCGVIIWPGPTLSYVTVQDENHIIATFDIYVWPGQADKYILFPKESPTDTIPVSSAESIDYNEVLLTLEESLIQGIIYTLRAENVCGEWACDTSEVDFLFEPVAVMLQGFEVKNGPEGVELSWELAGADGDISFEVSRRTAMGGEFEELGYIDIERYGDMYSCVDAYAEPGESYVYRVDYTLGTETAVLFETDAVQTPAAPLTLHQNVPNPFNPATEISYYLPAAADVLLEVYEVTGKRVATLERGRREKGLHLVTWQGMDDGGRAVQSGIYFYRLRAGKEVMSKKMVLLR